MFQGTGDSMTRSLTAWAPFMMKIILVAPTRVMYSVWIGGSPCLPSALFPVLLPFFSLAGEILSRRQRDCFSTFVSYRLLSFVVSLFLQEKIVTPLPLPKEKHAL